MEVCLLTSHRLVNVALSRWSSGGRCKDAADLGPTFLQDITGGDVFQRSLWARNVQGLCLMISSSLARVRKVHSCESARPP